MIGDFDPGDFTLKVRWPSPLRCMHTGACCLFALVVSIVVVVVGSLLVVCGGLFGCGGGVGRCVLIVELCTRQ